VATPTDGDWYLRSALLDGPDEPAVPLYQPGAPLYESYAQVLQGLNDLPTLQERVGNRQWAAAPAGEAPALWGRVEGSRIDLKPRLSTTGANTELASWKAQIGFDQVVREGEDSTVIAGLTAHYADGNADVGSIFGNGSIDTSAYGFGATLTWFGPDGLYADAQGQFTWFDSDVESDVIGALADGNGGKGQAASLEAGKRVALGGGLSLTPQAQVIYQEVEFGAFVDPFDAAVSRADGKSLRTRWGLSADHQAAWGTGNGARRSHLYGLVNLEYEWLDGTRVDVSGTPLLHAADRLWGEVAAGGSLGIGDRLTVYAQGSASTSLDNFGDSREFKGTAGIRFAF
jgi:fibronectin-binding autotransporter adhesin